MQKAGNTKTISEISKIEEEIKLAYLGLFSKDIGTGDNELSVINAIEDVKSRPQYQNKIEKRARNAGSTLTLSSNNVIVGKTAPNNTATITLETGSGVGENYYAVVDGKYYKIATDSNNIRIERTPTDFGGNGSSSEPTDVSVENGTGKATATYDSSTKTITITGVQAGTATVKLNGTELSASIEVINTLKTANMDLDGAMILNPNTNSNNGMITENEHIATITNEGAVMCSEKDGDVVIKTSDTEAYKVHSTAKIVKQKQPTTQTFDGQVVGTYDNPTIPSQFFAINTKSAKWINDSGANVVSSNVNNGLVIMDNRGNQFVWIPVKYPIYDGKDSAKVSALPISSSKGTNTEVIDDENETKNKPYSYIPMAIDKTTKNQDGIYHEEDDYAGILYYYSSSAGAYLIHGNKLYVTSGSCREPANPYLINLNLQSEYNKMIKSVSKYGGFWVGRYESSLINDKTSVIAGAISMNAEQTSIGSWMQLYTRQINFADDNDLDDYVSSSVIWGSQYDAMLNWMPISQVTVSGTTYTNTNRTTGTYIYDKIKNIFDLRGNMHEWSLEMLYHNRQKTLPTLRGGNYKKNWSAKERSESNSDYSFGNGSADGTICGSRVTLCII